MSYDWMDILKPALDEMDYSSKLAGEVAAGRPIYPEIADIFEAFTYFDPDQTKVVILGQDPYPRRRHPIGLSFAINPDAEDIPSSLGNILKELKADLGVRPKDLSLKEWAEQGVLLLNTHLTTSDTPLAHAGWGWDKVTGAAIEYLSQLPIPPVAILWGAKARDHYKKYSKGNTTFYVTSAHPCRRAASRGFFGSRPFSICNAMLKLSGREPIVWGEKL